MIEVDELHGLPAALVDVASDPGRVAVLHRILGEFCHQFRNKLNSLKLSLYLAKRCHGSREARIWTDLEEKYRDVEQFMDQFQLICRPMALAPVRLSLEMFVQDRRRFWESCISVHGRRLELLPPPEPTIGWFDPCRLAQGMDALVAWRAQAGEAGSPIRIRWWAQDDLICLEWDEPIDLHADDFAGSSQEQSLALPMLARIMSVHHGQLSLTLEEHWTLLLRWPREIVE